jgi:membrane protease YdiL (CAAX protease family)
MATSESVANSLDRAPMDILKALKMFSFLVTVTILQWFVLINPPGSGFSREVASIYMQMGTAFLVIVVLATSTGTIRLQSLRTSSMFVNGLGGFVIAWTFVLVVYYQYLGMTFGTVSLPDVWGLIVTQVLFVATVEEMVFRWLIPSYLSSIFTRRFRWLALLIPQASFAVFHVGVYQGDWDALAIAFVFGCVMMLAFNFVPPFGAKEKRKPLGLGFTIGAHAAYNLVLIGVLAPGGISLLIGG